MKTRADGTSCCFSLQWAKMWELSPRHSPHRCPGSNQSSLAICVVWLDVGTNASLEVACSASHLPLSYGCLPICPCSWHLCFYLQNYLRVAFQEVNSGCTGKTLLVRPYITTEDVCQLCAEKFKVEDPEEYSLFLFVDETWQQLAEDTYPQKIKAELHSRPQPHIFHFVYKRIKNDPYGVIFQNGEDLTPS